MVRVAERRERRWMEVKNDESEAGEKRGEGWMEDKIMKNYR